ncbi:MAG: hypothetical protein MRZ37_02030 [Tenericutes bacterium]|nr:hypothetical protein [Mycoplasmatota bacterium]
MFDGSKKLIGDLIEYGLDSLLDDRLFKSFLIIGFSLRLSIGINLIGIIITVKYITKSNK